MIAELGAANPSDSRLGILLGELLSLSEEAEKQQQIASKEVGLTDPTLLRLNIIIARKFPQALKAADALRNKRAADVAGTTAQRVELPELSAEIQEALSNVNAAIAKAGQAYDHQGALLKAAYRSAIHLDQAQPAAISAVSYESPVADQVDTDLLKDEDEIMNAPSREEFDAKILASEARMETRVARIEGSINTYLARSEGIEKSILLLSQQAAQAAQDASHYAQQATGIKTTLWVTTLTTVLSVLAIAISMYFATQSSNIGIVQATLAAFESGKSNGEKSRGDAEPGTAATQSKATSKDAN
ncbi:MAG: hypothetical protein ACXW3B_12520 [Telluria sp.]